MQYLRQLYDRYLAWRAARHAPAPVSLLPIILALPPQIGRDVTPHGIRVYSLCGSCGTRLGTSATLCEDCASRGSRTF